MAITQRCPACGGPITQDGHYEIAVQRYKEGEVVSFSGGAATILSAKAIRRHGSQYWSYRVDLTFHGKMKERSLSQACLMYISGVTSN